VNRSPLKLSSSLHETVREEVLQRIHSGVYLPEEPIPSVAMLSEEFAVSPITVKRALRDLQAGGVLMTIAGRGTYVKKQQRSVHHLDLGSFLNQNSEIKVRVLSVTKEKITDPTMKAIDAPSHMMLCLRKIILSGDAPFMYDATYVSSDLSDDLLEECGERFVIDALKRHGIDVVHTRLVVDAAPANGPVEDVFGVPSGYPMLRRLYRMTTSSPDITVYGVVQAPFDQLACSVDIPSRS
jgi:DNA-binding GntR family transcriptional regulator